ncbi:MAG: hypothetical protein HY471_03210 [Candidatus Sungbacteria bacterium]|nr:hypothetical protein [Candidatus Sungbacteria bacterium]
MEQKLIGLREAARVSGIHQDYLRVLINRKVISGVKVGRDWFITETELEKYLFGKRKRKGVQKFAREREIRQGPLQGDKGHGTWDMAGRRAEPRRHELRMRVRPHETLLTAQRENSFHLLNEDRQGEILAKFERRYASLYKWPQNGYVSKLTSHFQLSAIRNAHPRAILAALSGIILAAGISAALLTTDNRQTIVTPTISQQPAVSEIKALAPEDFGKALSEAFAIFASPTSKATREVIAEAKSISKSRLEGIQEGVLATGTGVKERLGNARGFAGVFQGIQPFFSRLFIGSNLKEVLTLPIIAPPDTAIVEVPEPTVATTTPRVSVDVREITREKTVTEVIDRREIIIPADVSRIRGELVEIVQIENNKMRAELASLSGDLFAIRGDLNTTSRVAGSSIQMVTISQKIDNLNSIDIDDGATIRSGSLTITAGGVEARSGTITGSEIRALGSLIADTDTLVVDATNNRVGIGTTSPFTTLSVNGNIYAAGITLAGSASTFTVDSSGNLGIGTTSPSGQLAIEMGTNAYPFWIGDNGTSSPSFVVTGGGRVGIGTTSPGATFSVNGDGLFSGSLTVANNLTIGTSTFTVISTTTAANQLVASYVPVTTHTFPTWSVGVANSAVSNASVYINPASAAADTNLLGLAINGTPKFLVDSDGDIFANSLTTAGTVTVGSTTASSFLVEGTLYAGDAQADTFIINAGTITYANYATSTITNDRVNAWSLATSTALTPIFTVSTASTTASGSGAVGVGTTSPYAKLSVSASTTAAAFAVRQVDSGNQGAIASFFDGTTEILTIDQAGRLGIGTTTPGALFSVAASGAATAGINPGNLLFAGVNTIYASSSTTTIPTAVNAYSFATSNTATPLLSFDTTNVRVGIGTSTPHRTLSVEGSGASLFVNTTSGIESGIYLGTNAAGKILYLGGTSATGLFINTNGAPLYMSNSDGGNTFALVSERVGIGTSTPGGLLSVSGGTTYPAFLLNQTSTGDLFTLQDSGSTVFTVKDGGNVGIGTTSPASTLSVQGNALISGNITSVANITATGTLTLSGTTGTSTIASGQGLTIGSSQFVVQQTSGRVGIGLTQPSSPLTVYRDGSDQGIGNPRLTAEIANSAGGNGVMLGYDSTAQLGVISAVGSNSGLEFYTHNGTSWGERIRIHTNGNIGIGTTSPWGLLSVEQGSSGPVFVVSDQGTSTPHLIIDGGGRVQLGTTTSSGGTGPYRLNVAGNIRANVFSNVQGDLSSTAAIELNTQSSGAVVRDIVLRNTAAETTGAGTGILFQAVNSLASVDGLIADASGNTALRFQTGDTGSGLTETMRIQGRGANLRVGIGTSTPGALFSLAGTSATSNSNLLLAGINTIYASSSTSTIPNGAINAWSIATTTTTATPHLSIDTSNNRIGILTAVPGATLHPVSTTQQLRLGYDASTYWGFTVASDNSLTIDRSASNLLVLDSAVLRPSSAAGVDLGNSSIPFSQLYLRNAINGVGTANGLSFSVTGSPGAGNTGQLFDFAGSTFNEAASGNHSILAGMVLRVPTVTTGDATVTNTANLYVVGPMTATVTGANYALWVDDGVSRFDGNVGIGTTSPATTLSVQGNALISGNLTVANITATGTALTLSGLPVNSLLTTNASGVLTATSTPTFGNFNATSTTATSTISTGGFAVGTSQFVVQQNSGNVGVGTLTPGNSPTIQSGSTGRLLHLYAAASKPAEMFFSAGDGAGRLWSVNVPSAGTSFRIGRSTVADDFTIDNSGNVGIGTTSPSARLAVRGSTADSTAYAAYVEDSAGTARFAVRNDGIIGFGTTTFTTSPLTMGGRFVFSTPSTEVGHGVIIQDMRAGSEQVVALNVDAPSYSEDTANLRLLRLGSGANTKFIVANNGETSIGLFGVGSNAMLQVRSTSTVATNYIARFSDGNSEHKFVFTNDAKLGIGTTSPSARLAVRGAGTATGYLAYLDDSAGTVRLALQDNGNLMVGTSTAIGVLTVEVSQAGGTAIAVSNPNSTADGAFSELALYQGTGNKRFAIQSNNAGDTGGTGGAGATLLWNFANGPMIFAANNAERMRITASGNVGIGTTSPATTLSVQGNALISGNLTVANITATGTLTFSGSALGTNMLTAINGSNQLVSTSTPTLAAFSATSTTATSTILGKLTIGNGLTAIGSSTLTVANNIFLNPTWDAGTARLQLYLQESNLSSRIFAQNYYLDLESSGTNQNQIRFFTGTAAGSSAQGTQRMVIDSSGNVGIGTTTPNWLLQAASINPSFVLTDTDASSNAQHWFLNNGNTGGALTIGTTTNTFSATSTYLTVANGGNIGVGTTTPNQLLDLLKSGSTTVATAEIRQYAQSHVSAGPQLRLFASRGTPSSPSGLCGGDCETSGGDVLGRVQFAGRDSAGQEVVGAEIVAVAGGTGGNGAWSNNANSSELRFYNIPTSSGTLTNRLTIRPDGTALFTNNITTLTFNGSNGNLALGDNGNMTISSGQYFGYNIGDARNAYYPSGPTDSTIGTINTAGDFRINIDSDNGETTRNFIIGNNQTTGGSSNALFTVLESGNVGIGTTSPTARLSIGGGNIFFSGGQFIYASSSTSTIPSAVNALSFATSDTATPLLSLDTTNSRVGIGTANPEVTFHVVDNSGGGGNLVLDTYRNASGQSIIGGRFSRGTLASPQIVSDGDRLADFRGLGMDANNGNFRLAGLIGIEVDGTPGASDMPGRIVLSTTPDGTANVVERMRITNAGLIGIGTTSPATALSVQGNALISGNLTVANITATGTALTLSGLPVNSLLTTNASGVLTATSTPTFGNFNATSTVATSTLSTGGLAIGTSQFVVQQNSGNVGIGTAAPTEKLTVAGHLVLSGTNSLLSLDATQRVYIRNNPTDSLQFVTPLAGTAMQITSSGNVGIGTTTPNWLLQVNGTRPSFALSDSSAGANLKHWLFSSMGGNLYVGTSTDAYGTSTPAALTITNAGNVGIGAAAPLAPLDVRGGDIYIPRNNSITGSDGAGNTRSLVRWLSSSDTIVVSGDGPDVLFSSATSPSARLSFAANDTRLELTSTAAGSKLWYLSTQGAGGAYMANGFIIRNNTDAVNAVAITNSGLVGIGTTSPATTLSVQGNALISGNLNSVANITATGTITQNAFAYTSLTASTEKNDVNLNLARTVQFASGALTTQRAVLIQAPTYSFTASSTLTDASTLAITGAPRSGTFATTTNVYALNIAAGSVTGAGIIPTNAYGLYVNVPTGATNNYGAVFASGNVGVGTTTPVGRLTIANLATDATQNLFYVASSTASATTTHFFISNSGRVGIGTVSSEALGPVAGLEIGVANKSTAIGSGLGLNITNNGNASTYSQIGLGYALADQPPPVALGMAVTASAGNSKGDFFIATRDVTTATAPTERLFITSSGNVGIGTTSPAARLSIGGGNIFFSGGQFVYASSSTSTIPLSTVNAWSIATSTNTGTPYLSIDSSNHRIGIGTSSPIARLHVFGNSSSVAGQTTHMVIEDNATSISPALMLRNTSGSSAGTRVIFTNSNDITWQVGTDIGTSNNTDTFQIQDADLGGGAGVAIRGGSPPRVGIGTTTPNSNSLTVYAESNSGVSAAIEFGANTGSTNRWTMGNDQNDAFKFKIASSSALGTNDRFVIDGSGKVGVGTTSPGGLLSVSGGTVYPAFLLNQTSTGDLLTLQDGGTTVFTVKDGGNVGVGTTSPFGLLSVEQGTETASLWVGNTGSSTPSLVVQGVNGNGNVGVGVALPSAALHVAKATEQLRLESNGSNYTTFTQDNNGDLAIDVTRYMYLPNPTRIGSAGDLSITQLVVGGTSAAGIESSISITQTVNPGVDRNSEILAVNGTIVEASSGTHARLTGISLGAPIITAGGAAVTDAMTLYISGAPSATVTGGNYALYSVSGTNYFGGNVGIGTTSPAWSLQIAGTRASTTISDTSAGTNLKHWTLSSQGGNFYIATSSDTYATSSVPRLTILSTGFVGIGTSSPASELSIQGTCVDTGTGCADVAELYTSTEFVEAGEIVAVDPNNAGAVRKATTSQTAIGIVSTAPAMTIEGSSLQFLQGSRFQNDPLKPAIALVGRVPVKVNLEGGEIHPGDRITISSVPGIGRKATTSTYTVGIALTPFDGWTHSTDSTGSPQAGSGQATFSEEGSVRIFVNLGYSKLDAGAERLATSDMGQETSNGWSVDQTSGKVNVNFFGDINANGNKIINVAEIVSQNGLWRLDDTGRLTAKYVETEHLTVGSAINPTGITLFDHTTKEPYCVFVDAGSVKSLAGTCEAASAGTAESTPVAAPEDSASTGSEVPNEPAANEPIVTEAASTESAPSTSSGQATSTPITTEPAPATEPTTISSTNAGETASSTPEIIPTAASAVGEI